MDTYNSEEISEHFIDIDKVIKEKNPRLFKFLPHFIINYLKKLVHQEDLNGAIYRNRDKFGTDFCDAILEEFQVNINIKGLENIPATGKYIVTANHPLGGIDGMALMSSCGKARKDIVFPVNDFLMYLPGLRPIFIPINKHGSNAENLKIIEDSFASDKLMLYFPAGLCSRKQSGKILDLTWKKTVISRARKHKRDVIPCHIEGKNSEFFYNLANLRKRLGIKANLEMILLADEMYKQKDKNINLIFEKPIPYLKFDKTFSDEDWAQKLKGYVYELEKINHKPFEEYINSMI